MTTLPQIDVDLGIPTAEVTAGTPEVDLAIPGVRGLTGNSRVVFGTKGTVSGALQGSIPYYPRINGRIVKVTLALGDQDSGVTIADVNIDDVTIYTDQSQRPQCASTGRHFDDGGTAANNEFTDTQAITVDRDAAGTGAEDFIVTVEYEPT